MASVASPMAARNGFDLPPAVRSAILVGGSVVALASTYAILRALLGLAPTPQGAKDIAVVIHLATVVPAIPLGLVVFLSRKGGRRHRLLGRIWMALMAVTAVSTLFIRHLNDGELSFIHLFSVLTLLAIPSAIAAARKGRITSHRYQLVGLFGGALVIAGIFSFVPGRIMWTWLVG